MSRDVGAIAAGISIVASAEIVGASKWFAATIAQRHFQFAEEATFVFLIIVEQIFVTACGGHVETYALGNGACGRARFWKRRRTAVRNVGIPVHDRLSQWQLRRRRDVFRSWLRPWAAARRKARRAQSHDYVTATGDPLLQFLNGIPPIIQTDVPFGRKTTPFFIAELEESPDSYRHDLCFSKRSWRVGGR